MVKLQVGQWYKFYPYSNLLDAWYMKYLEDSSGFHMGSEYISSITGYAKSVGNFGKEYSGEFGYQPINVSEIAHLLPKNHPDLINSSSFINQIVIW